jgi:hypothetical protein
VTSATRGQHNRTGQETARRRALVFPREHGAWGMLLVPLVTGGVLGLLNGGRLLPLAPLTLGALGLFWLRTPVENLMGATPLRPRAGAERNLVLRTIFLISSVSAIALAALLWTAWSTGLLWVALCAGAAFLAQASLKKLRPRARTSSQIIGAAGLSATAAAAYCVSTGYLPAIAWSVWLANFLFSANQIHFVHVRISAAKALGTAEKFRLGRGFLAGQLSLAVALTAGCAAHLFPPYMLLAFAPALYRGFKWYASRPDRLAIRALGWAELAQSLAFGVLLVSTLK